MTTWEELDTYMKDQSDVKAQSGMLRAHITVLLTKRMITYDTDADKIQQLLRERYDVEYRLTQITYEIMDMIREDWESNRYVLIKEEPE